MGGENPLQDEGWVAATGFENRWLVNHLGQVWSMRAGRIVIGMLTDGYRNLRYWEGGKPKVIGIHRLVWQTFEGEIPQGFVIDHKDRNKTNNRLSNLRLATVSQNVTNSGKRKNKTATNFLGVVRANKNLRRPYQCFVKKDRKQFSSRPGYFACETAAAIARDKLALQLHGDSHVALNFEFLRERFIHN